MDVTVNLFIIGGAIILAMLIGYFAGRSERKQLKQEQMEEGGNGERKIFLGKSIASPVAGRVQTFQEEGRKGVVIEPGQSKIYAPMSGKITRLFPMGNAFILRADDTECSEELLIQVGRKVPDELCSMYYRPYIMQNEIVSKGKLLLTFDRERLQAAGEDVAVLVSLDAGLGSGEVRVTPKENVKVGDELIWVANNG